MVMGVLVGMDMIMLMGVLVRMGVLMGMGMGVGHTVVGMLMGVLVDMRMVMLRAAGHVFVIYMHRDLSFFRK